MKKQLGEILERHGPIDLLWIDQYANKYTAAEWPAMRAFLKSRAPRTLVLANNSHDLGETDVLSYEFPWAGTLPPEANASPAEVCDTIQTGQRWFWRAVTQPSDLQPAADVAERLRVCNARRASYLLNVPPDKDGLVSGAHLQRLREAGALARAR
jgi:alpha-L-fucosidase